MDILNTMKKDHRTALDLIESLEKCTDKADEKTRALVQKLCEEVKLHSQSEEKALYEACENKNVSLRDFALEGENEHHLIDEMLDKLASVPPGKDGEFKAALAVVKELLVHHAFEEEEKEAFPKIKKAFDTDERSQMAQTMDNYKEKIASQVKKDVEAHLTQ